MLRTLIQEKAPIMLRTVGDDGIDLLKRLLTLDPAERISAEEALKLPFLKKHFDLYLLNSQ